MDTIIHDTTQNSTSLASTDWDERLARFISNILCPPVVILFGLILVFGENPDPMAWRWAVLAIVFMVIIPAIYVQWKVRQGEISDFHIPIRTQRYRPILVTIGCSFLSWALMVFGHAPHFITTLTAIGILHGLFLFIVTLRWKISGHSTAIAGICLLLIHFFGQACIPSLMLIPLVAWARVRIRRHTPAQTAAGAISGMIYIGLVLLMA
jgi:membrane-associated phospholipid phosphatase